jgi:hypothetical protein
MPWTGHYHEPHVEASGHYNADFVGDLLDFDRRFLTAPD